MENPDGWLSQPEWCSLQEHTHDAQQLLMTQQILLLEMHIPSSLLGTASTAP